MNGWATPGMWVTGHRLSCHHRVVHSAALVATLFRLAEAHTTVRVASYSVLDADILLVAGRGSIRGAAALQAAASHAATGGRDDQHPGGAH